MQATKSKARLGVICCFGVNGANCAACPYYEGDAIEDMVCDMNLARDLLTLLGEKERSTERE